MSRFLSYFTSIPRSSDPQASRIASAVRTAARKRPIATRAPLVLTQAAVSRVKELLSERPDGEALRIGVRTRGCNGLSYTLDYCKKAEKFDVSVEQDGVKIVIDAKAQLTLLGTEMDYQKGKLSSEFVFLNPNIKGTCGCGESFSV